jgi:hypothetical protein
MKPMIKTLVLTITLTTITCVALAQSLPLPGMDESSGCHEGVGSHRSCFAVVNDLEHLQRLYDLNGREDEMNVIYHDVLQRTQIPVIRQYVYVALARNLLRPADADQAIATLRMSLDEDLTALAKRPSAP